MNSSTKVLPPANGKKLWRVKKAPSSSPNEPSNECFNNSLKMSAAGSKFSVRRPPLRRPKNKPGKPKDFVFVDLSPIKSAQEEIEAESKLPTAISSATIPSPTHDASQFPSQLPSPALSIEELGSKVFELPQLNESFSSISDDDSIFSQFDNSRLLDSAISDYMQVNNTTYSAGPQTQELGLGIMNMDINWNQPQSIHSYPDETEQKLYDAEQALLQQNQQIQMLQEQLKQVTGLQLLQNSSPQAQSLPLPKNSQLPKATNLANIKKRSKSTSDVNSKRKNAGQIQFRTYTGPKKKPIKHRHSYSDSFVKPSTTEINTVTDATLNTTISSAGFDDFMMFNDQLLPQQSSGSFTPVTDYSDEEEVFSKSKDFDANLLGCGLDQFLPKSETFDYSFAI